MMYKQLINFILILFVSPFLFGVINKTKAFFGGRKGQPLLQLYYDIYKLFKKGAVYSKTTTWIFVFGPIVGLSALFVAAMLMPFAGYPALIPFKGDIVLFFYLLALARFFTVVAALDTGSSFEGMGASREVQFSVFAEPALFLSLAVLVRITGKLSLSEIFSRPIMASFSSSAPVIFLVLGALFIIFLAENSRIPVDDPKTHLELTMIHEAMVLDHGGVDLAFVLCASAIRFWILGTLLVGMFVGHFSNIWCLDIGVYILAMIAFAIVVGVVESILVRLRLLKVPHFLIISLALAIVALILTMR